MAALRRSATDAVCTALDGRCGTADWAVADAVLPSRTAKIRAREQLGEATEQFSTKVRKEG